MCNTDLNNGNVFLTGNGYGKSPKVWSSFDRAEREILGELRKMASDDRTISGGISMNVVQVDTNLTKRHTYNFRIVRDGFFGCLKIKFYMNGESIPRYCLREKYLLNIDKALPTAETSKITAEALVAMSVRNASKMLAYIDDVNMLKKAKLLASKCTRGKETMYAMIKSRLNRLGR